MNLSCLAHEEEEEHNQRSTGESRQNSPVESKYNDNNNNDKIRLW